MRVDKDNKLQFFKDLFENAKGQQSALRDDFDKWSKQYKGDLTIDGSDEPALTGRNITYELIESQFSSYLPSTAVTPEVYSERNDRNAKSIERLLKNKRNQLPFEKMNDIDERYSPIYGGSIWLVEWDNSIKTHNTVGDVKITCWSPSHFVGQPCIYDIDDMEYCFITFETTKEDLVRKYGVPIDVTDDTESENGGETDETATVNVCYYKNDEDKICQYIWSGDTELQDIEDYYSRKVYVCKNCGRRKELCTCDKPDYELQDDEYEELDHDIVLSDGSVIPAASPVMKDGQVVMEESQQQAVLEDGSVAMDEINGIMIPATVPVQVPKLERTKLPYYTPSKFPIIIRKNTSQENSLFGQSDCEFIRPQQQAINKIESRILEKLMNAGVYPTAPEDYIGQFDNGLYKNVIKVGQGNYKLFGRIDLQVDLTQDISQSERLYQQSKRIMGITDSYQGQADSTAQSGKAKQIQVNQSAGRLDSKRKMKNAAYAEIDEVIFLYYLAYADEPRAMSYVDSMGRLQNAQFNRYDFIERDENGEYYYNTQYLFGTDPTGDVEQSRETIWSENRLNFQNGCYGNPQQLETLLIFWQQMERHHYPDARDMVERIRGIIEAQREQLEQQLAVEQQKNKDLQTQAYIEKERADGAEGYLEYINKMGGKAQ
ncbi:MAG: hypothetical protein SO386_02140 [Eubacteriales bacterium]|nr:hypothetical protein [Eubacteriales bacterium]